HQAFLDNDAFQCGYCTPGQICSAAGVLQEAADGRPSVITDDPPRADGPGPEQHDPPEFDRPVELTDEEIRERMSGNLCRCGAYPVDHLKLGVTSPDLLVDLGRLDLADIEDLADGGLRIGAMVRNSDLAADPRVRRGYPVLSRALLSGASGQLRNAATTGGNLLQRTRCVYFQDITTPCNKREPGSGCSALGGYARYPASLGAAEQCIATRPSDLAVALTALEATVVVPGADGRQRIPVAELPRLPGDDPHLDTVLEHGDLITAVEMPAPVP